MKRFSLAFRQNTDGVFANDFLEKLGKKNRSKSDFIAACITDYLISQGITDISSLTETQANLIARRKIRGDRGDELTTLLLSELRAIRAENKSGNIPATSGPEEKTVKPIKEEHKEIVQEKFEMDDIDELEDEELFGNDDNDADDTLLSMLDDF